MRKDLKGKKKKFDKRKRIRKRDSFAFLLACLLVFFFFSPPPHPLLSQLSLARCADERKNGWRATCSLLLLFPTLSLLIGPLPLQ